MNTASESHADGGAGSNPGAAVSALYDLTLLLRRKCPWDRAQTAGTIVPHTLEEAYEVADVVRRLDSGEEHDLHTLEDELGDLLFQVSFLTMLCEEQDPSITLGTVARRIHQKLVRRHPHVFGDEVQAETADEVRGAWETVKRTTEQRALFDGIPMSMPAASQARKVQERAATVGFDFDALDPAFAKVDEELAEARAAVADAVAGDRMPEGESAPPDPPVEHEVGDLLFAAVNVARLARVDPELALRDATSRFRGRVELAVELAAAEGTDWASLSLPEQEAWYQRAKSTRTA